MTRSVLLTGVSKAWKTYKSLGSKTIWMAATQPSQEMEYLDHSSENLLSLLIKKGKLAFYKVWYDFVILTPK